MKNGLKDYNITFNETSNGKDIVESMEKMMNTFIEALKTDYNCPVCGTQLMIGLIYDDYVDLYCPECEKLVKAKIWQHQKAKTI